MDLNQIKDPAFLKTKNLKELESLTEEIRVFLIDHISETGGHLASNLGVVELSIALHYVFDSPKDTFIFDVSHQAYVHKILTGRASEFNTLRQQGGLSGYASYKESIHDKWESGHAGTSIAAQVGYLYANELNNIEADVISIVGDASITNGTNMEALNLLGSDSKHKGIIVLNDNKMSISKSVGSLSNFLMRLRGSKLNNFIRKVFDKILPDFLFRMFRQIKRSVKALFQARNMFEDIGYVYIGPIDGNNLKRLIKTLEYVKKMKRSVVLHVVTQKGKGYKYAEDDIEGSYHGVSPFDKETGVTLSHPNGRPTWSEVISTIIEKLEEERHIMVVMPAMLVGAKFTDFQQKYPHRIVDVGIAEELAADMSAALALNKVDVFLPLYSTFSQRAYDQILHDIARPNLKVVIGIDRAGFVGEDGQTHQGLYDISMFLSMPNVTVTMPRNMAEAYGLLRYGFNQSGPFVIRYPRGKTVKMPLTNQTEIGLSWEMLKEGSRGMIISYGPVLDDILARLSEENLDYGVMNARYINPIDTDMLEAVLKTEQSLLVYEQTHASGALYQKILDYMAQNNYHNKIVSMSTYNKVISHGTLEDNMNDAGLSLDDLVATLKKL